MAFVLASGRDEELRSRPAALRVTFHRTSSSFLALLNSSGIHNHIIARSTPSSEAKASFVPCTTPLRTSDSGNTKARIAVNGGPRIAAVENNIRAHSWHHSKPIMPTMSADTTKRADKDPI